VVPDRQIIMKVKLTACGYKENELLAKKFNVLYALCEQQLSKCPHYDFGLRNILAVLRTAGESKRNNLTSPELLLLMRTLRDMNLSKFVAEDVPLFLSLIGDLFPGQKADKMEHPYLEGPLVEVVKNLGLQMHGLWKEKIIQLWEMALVRHSVMLVGPAGVGKTRILEVLMATLTACTAAPGLPALVGENHREQRINPKAITAPQMFGCLDVVANEWTEGIFAQLWRKANKDKKNFTWLVLDGPVDAIWIENMNTVMDDNKSTCLNRNRIAARTHLSPSRACLPQGRHRRPLQQLPCRRCTPPPPPPPPSLSLR
jgi:dynein heavy chain